MVRWATHHSRYPAHEEHLAHVSLYRKYRSQTFGDLIGQDHVIRTLQNAIAGARIAHAYLFTGPRGTGKTSTARLLAKALCCEKGPTAEPCGECDLCRGVTDGSLMDVREIDAASEAGVEKVRESIIDVVDYVPTDARYKIFIIDEVHDLSKQAFDALLKTIEEPPAHIIFILATTEYTKVPPTIRSRCQKFEFHRASLTDLHARLSYVAKEEGIEIEPAALAAIARMADGGFRDALTLLEQARLVADETITVDLVYDQLGMVAEEVSDRLLLALHKGDDATIMRELAELAKRGRDPRGILESLVSRAADLTHMLFGLDHGVDASLEAAAHATSVEIGKDALVRLRGSLSTAHQAIKDITLPRLWLEGELLRLAHPAPVVAASAPPAQAVVETARHTPSPAPTPQRTVPDRPQPERAAPEPEKKPAPAPTAPIHGDADWAKVMAHMFTVSKALHAKVLAAIPEVDGDRLILKFERKIDLDWVEGDARKTGAILDSAKTIYASVTRIETQHQAKAQADGVAPVELTLQGRELHDAIREEIDGRKRESDEAS